MKERKQSSSIEYNTQLIKYKGIKHERFEDAPFVGALIIANHCFGECANCFNKHLITKPYIENTASEILDLIQSNPMNEGIILGGLEWTHQPYGAFDLAYVALLRKLKVILYTSLEEEGLRVLYPYIYDLPIYIKFGKYIDGHKSHKDKTGVRLASPNQYISSPEDRR
jgi:hypothetical protein